MQNLNVWEQFYGKREFSGNNYLKPEESPEDRWFCIENNLMSPYNLHEILSGFSFLVSNFSHLSIIIVRCIQHSITKEFETN